MITQLALDVRTPGQQCLDRYHAAQSAITPDVKDLNASCLALHETLADLDKLDPVAFESWLEACRDDWQHPDHFYLGR